MYQYGKEKFSLSHSLDLKGLIVYSNNAQSVIYCNFHPFTHTADDSHCLIFAITRKKISTDYLHPKKKENHQLTQSSFNVFVDISFSV